MGSSRAWVAISALGACTALWGLYAEAGLVRAAQVGGAALAIGGVAAWALASLAAEGRDRTRLWDRIEAAEDRVERFVVPASEALIELGEATSALVGLRGRDISEDQIERLASMGRRAVRLARDGAAAEEVPRG